MLNTEEEKALKEAISKLQDIYDQGEEIRGLLENGPSGRMARDGAVVDAAKKVAKKWKCKIGNERARKSIEFVKAFTHTQLRKLVTMCTKHGFAPEFGTIVRLLPLKPRERNQWLKLVIENRLTKADLDAELELQKPTKGDVDKNRRGRLPNAAKSLRALKGQAAVDARRYAHILDVLEQENANFKLTKSQKNDLKALSEILRKVSKWKG